MLSTLRKKKILQLAEKHRSISIQRLAEKLNVSLNTIRTDINQIMKESFCIQKIHGGVIFNIESEPTIDIRYLKNNTEKQKIGKLVAKELLKYNNPSIFMDSSTSTYYVAKEFSKHLYPATIITYAVDVLYSIGANSNIFGIGLGGTWWGAEHCFIGPEVIDGISHYQVNIAILGTSGLSMETGVFNGNIATADIKKNISKSALETWIVCESTKFDQNYLVKFLDFSSVTKIFTNSKISLEWEDFLSKNNIDIFY